MCRRQRAGWRFHDHIAEMADMLDLHLNAIALLHKQRRVTLFPTPPGDPVMITSPGLKRVKVLMYSISSATLWIMLLVLSSCTMRPFSQVRIAS
jgi:hypothetical protein